MMANRSWFSSKKGGPATFTQAAGFLNEKDDELLVAIYDRKIFKGGRFFFRWLYDTSGLCSNIG
jgi:hypothetical protein